MDLIGQFPVYQWKLKCHKFQYLLRTILNLFVTLDEIRKILFDSAFEKKKEKKCMTRREYYNVNCLLTLNSKQRPALTLSGFWDMKIVILDL